jgi:ubiquinone biosynthesis protein UbiJ
MASTSPFSFLDTLIDRVGQALQPPPWFVLEAQRRLVLMVNHVLMQEPEAQTRLRKHAGSVVQASWRQFDLSLQVTPAGLFDLAEPAATPDLTLALTQDSPVELTRTALRGDTPPVLISGGVQFAAEISWVVEHVRWDVEEDLSRLLGDAPAHALAEGARGAAAALRRFAGDRRASGQDGPRGQDGPDAGGAR